MNKTGPKTAAGKAAVSRNALQHGLTASDGLLPDEDAQEYGEFWDAFYKDLKPVGAVEQALFFTIVSRFWRLRRLPAVEAAILHRAEVENQAILDAAMPAFYPELSEVRKGVAGTFQLAEPALSLCVRYSTALERSAFRALSTLMALRKSKAKLFRKKGTKANDRFKA